jgi:hypothetical protein
MSDEAERAEVAPVAEDDVVTLAGPPRVKTVELTYPATYRGRTYRQIGIKRMTTREVADFVERLQHEDGDNAVRFPMVIDDDGALVPEVVLDGLDDDDAAAINEAVVSFLPQRLRALIGDTRPRPGGATSASSHEG